MSQHLANLRETIRRRPGRVLLGLVGCVLLGALATWVGPQLQAGYHLRAARTALRNYHNDEAQAHLDECLRTWSQHAEVQLLASRCARCAEAFDQAQEH